MTVADGHGRDGESDDDERREGTGHGAEDEAFPPPPQTHIMGTKHRRGPVVCRFQSLNVRGGLYYALHLILLGVI